MIESASTSRARERRTYRVIGRSEAAEVMVAHERDQVGADRLCLVEHVRRAPRRRVGTAERSVGDRLPPQRGGERELYARLEVRLVEDRKELLRIARHEERVQVRGAVRRIPHADDAGAGGGDEGGEFRVDPVRARHQRRTREPHVMPVELEALRRDPIHPQPAEPRPAEIQHQIGGARQREPESEASDRGVASRDVEGEVVADVTHAGGAILRERRRHARSHE
jgi:hypothetical protein